MKVKEPICIMVATGSSCLEVPRAYSVTRQTYEKTFQQPNYVKFDVMLNDRYVCTMRYRHLPVFAITEKEIVDYVISQRPSLKNKPFIIAF